MTATPVSSIVTGMPASSNISPSLWGDAWGELRRGNWGKALGRLMHPENVLSLGAILESRHWLGEKVADMMGPKTRRVIITGDDFGLAPVVNAAIIRSHREGMLTSASLIIIGPAWQEAVDLAQANPKLGVGFHPTLFRAGSLAAPPDSTLVNTKGNFRDDPVGAGLTYFFSRQARQEIRAELEAQVEKMLAAGVHPQFLNGHLIYRAGRVRSSAYRAGPRGSIQEDRRSSKSAWNPAKDFRDHQRVGHGGRPDLNSSSSANPDADA